MRAKEWRGHDDEELAFQLKELKKRIFELQFKSASEEIADTKEMHRAKKDVARVLTIMRERKQRAAAAQTAGEGA